MIADTSDKIVFRLIHDCEWKKAQETGLFHGGDLDKDFIHLSTRQQVAETARVFFQNQADILLLSIQLELLNAPVRWEVSRNNEKFPHLFGPLPISAVKRVDPLPLDPKSGELIFPENF